MIARPTPRFMAPVCGARDRVDATCPLILLVGQESRTRVPCIGINDRLPTEQERRLFRVVFGLGILAEISCGRRPFVHFGKKFLPQTTKKNNMKRGCGSTLGVADSVYRRRGVRCSFGPANLNLSQVLGQLGVWLPQPHTKGHARTHLSHARKDCLTARITRRWVHPNNSAR